MHRARWLHRACWLALVALAVVGCPTATPVKPPPKPTPSVKPVAQPKKPFPPSAVKVVTDTYHGVKVADPYRWLEDGNAEDVKHWSAAQNGYARSVLDALPSMAPLRARLSEIMKAQTSSYSSLAQRPGKLFAMLDQPPKQQPFLIVMPSADAPDKARTLLDPGAIDDKGTTAIDWFVPSPDGKLVAVSLSKGGTETGDLHVYDVDSGKEVYEVVERVNGGTAGGTLAWSPDGKGFFYSRYPRAGERPEADMAFYVQVYYHALGTTPDKDRYEIGKDFPRIAEVELDMHDKSGRLLATVQKGDGGEFALYLRSKDGTWRQISDYPDAVLQGAFGPKDALYLLSRNDAPRGKVLRISAAEPDMSKAETVVPEGKDTIVDSFWAPPSVLPTDTRLYVLYQLGGPSEIRVFDHAGKELDKPTQLPVGAAGGMLATGKDGVLFDNWSFVVPSAFYRYGGTGTEVQKTALTSEPPVDMSQVKVVREMAKSADGVDVPVNILLPPGYTPGKPIPCLVNGYGGYGVSVGPRYRASYHVLLSSGMCFAIANIRGGGEFGEEWHRQGNLTRKQNVFNDFTAVLEHLVARGYTTNDKLAIIGGSNGGLLMGAIVTQHPEMIRAAVSFVGIYDMLRVELSPNGAFNVTEFGTVKDRMQFEALHAYSPYHRVKDGVAYPAMLMLTGENDPRVDPMQSRKMTARLQAATSATAPILLRTSSDAGHGGDTSLEEEIAQLTDAYGFIMAQLGVELAKDASAAEHAASH